MSTNEIHVTETTDRIHAEPADNFERVGDTVRGVAGAKRRSADNHAVRSLSAAAAAEYRTPVANIQRTHRTRESHETALEDTGYASV